MMDEHLHSFKQWEAGLIYMRWLSTTSIQFQDLHVPIIQIIDCSATKIESTKIESIDFMTNAIECFGETIVNQV